MKTKRLIALSIAAVASLSTLHPYATAQSENDTIIADIPNLDTTKLTDIVDIHDLLSMQDNYLQRQKKLKSAAWKCLWIGGTAAALGAATFLATLIATYDTNNDGDTVLIISSTIAGAGVASMVASVPLFIAAHRNGKRANDITVALSLTSISEPAPSFTAVGMSPAASPAISFSLTF